MKKIFTFIAALTLSVGLFAEETILATGPWEAQGWNSQSFLLSDGGTELANIGVEAGDVINFYIEPTKDDWAFQIWEGHWGSTYASICAPHLAGTSGYESYIACDLSANGGKYALTLTQKMIDAALTTQWWGGTFLIIGDGVVVTKLTIVTSPTIIFVDEASGLTFRITDSGEVNNVMVIPNNDESHTYSGDIVIPSTVNYHDTIFTVTEIGSGVFRNCTELTSITIPNSVTTIGSNAFASCYSLTSVTIPNSVTTIGSNAFDFVNNIVYNGTATGSPWGAKCVNGYVEGYLVYSDASKTTLCGCATAATGEITIPNSVITIGNYAFYNCSGLTSVTIPNSVTTIGFGAFSGCTSLPIENNIRYADTYLIEAVDRTLSTYTIKEGTKWIGGSAFEGCSGLTSIIIPNSVIEIEGWGVFSNCTSLESVIIGNSVKTIGNGTFNGCSSLTSVTIPNSVTKIEAQAFSWSGLKDVSVNWTSSDQLPTMESDVFIGIANYTGPSAATLHVPAGTKSIYEVADQWKDFGTIIADQQDTKSSVITYTATEKLKETTNTWNSGLHTNAFNVEITSHTFSNGTGTITFAGEVTTIGEDAFAYCKGLTSIVIPNSVTTIGKDAFYFCEGLTSVTIGNSVTTIGKTAFEYCSALTSINIPASVITIGRTAFGNCSSLTSITIPNSVTTIGEWAFYQCSALTSVTIPNSVSSIGEYTFSGCSALTSVTIGNSVTTIGERAFDGCSSLTSITIPNSVTTIGMFAFGSCGGLTSVTVGNSVKTIGESAFNGCSGLTSIDVDAANTHYSSVDGVLFNYAKDTLIQYPIGNTRTKYIIPNSVKTIGERAFEYCNELSLLTIGNSVTTIGGSAFWCCFGLTLIDVDAANTHYSSVDGVLFNYAKDTLIQYPIGNTRTEYTIPNSVKAIKDDAFAYSTDLTSVTIGNSVTEIGEAAFYECTGLTSVTIGNSVTTIGNWAFFGCTGLTSVTIPNSVTTLGYSAFRECSNLTSVTIPNSVTTIEECAFYWCEVLTSITCYAVIPPKCVGAVFSGINYNAKVYVPASALVDYQNAEVWKDMLLLPIAADVTPMDDENPIILPTDQDVTITWAITDGTDTYTLTITKNGEVVCVLTFNAQGQLLNIAFAAPGHDGSHQAPAATLTAQGYQFTVTGLDPGTAYDYSVTATDAGGQTLAEHKGNFSTTGGTGLNTLPYEGKDWIGSKYFHNGNLIIERNGIKYTATGQKVK